MTRFMSLTQVEKAALEESNECQDSQAILDALKAEFGIGAIADAQADEQFATRSLFQGKKAPIYHIFDARGSDWLQKPSLVPGDVTPPLATKEKQAAGSDPDVLTDTAIQNETPQNDVNYTDNLPETAPVDQDFCEDDAPVVFTGIDHAPRPTSLSAKDEPLLVSGRGQSLPPKSMDGSQQTPTQVNEDRDYATFCERSPLSPAGDTQLTTSEEPRTLNPNDTGAVNFGSLSELARPSSQASEDGGFENTRGQWRLPNDSATPYKPHDLPPQTPALPNNPFGARSDAGAVPFGATQLFGQTQMLSSAVKLATPTSSRPSPAVLFNALETSPLKNRTNVSSPTEIQISSPTRAYEVPATVLKDKNLSIITEETPVSRQSQKDDLIPDSPTTFKQSAGFQPMAYYEPMKYSQERKDSNERSRKPNPDNAFDDDLEKLERKKRVKKKRAMAAKEMDKVSFIRTQRKPSSSDERPGKRRKFDAAADASETKESKPNSTSQPCVRDSQKIVSQSAEPPSLESTKATPGEVTEDETEGTETPEPVPSGQQPVMRAVEEETIPATSPLHCSPAVHRQDAPSASEPELPTLKRSGSEREIDVADSSSLPPIQRRPRRTYGRRSRGRRTRLAMVSSADADSDGATEHSGESHAVQLSNGRRDDAEKSEDTVKAYNMPTGSNSEPATRMATRSTPRPSRPVHSAVTSSSLTSLPGTPFPSSKTTPGTQVSPVSERPESINLIPSEKSGRPSRKSLARHTTGSESSQPMTNAMRLSRPRRSLRVDSDSNDELHRSPSRSVRTSRTSLAQAPRSRRLFDGMVFALSFSEDNKTDNNKTRRTQIDRTKLEAKITQAGGTILHEGFQELFEASSILDKDISLGETDGSLIFREEYIKCRFAAVIANSASRKPKYIQALALGLPCLAHHWVSTCLKKGEIIDWMPYLLCAGPSRILDGAMRSRTLSPYQALDARLVDRLQERDKLLKGQKLLILTNKKELSDERKEEYLFVALTLGPSLISRVSTVQQAGHAVREAEQSGSPFGWVYLDSPASLDRILAAAQEASKKKRKSIGETFRQELKVMTSEVMIQSLILGRMVEDDEMHLCECR